MGYLVLRPEKPGLRSPKYSLGICYLQRQADFVLRKEVVKYFGLMALERLMKKEPVTLLEHGCVVKLDFSIVPI